MAFKSFYRNSDTQSAAWERPLRTFKTIKTTWVQNGGLIFLCFILLVLTIYILPYYAVTKKQNKKNNQII